MRRTLMIFMITALAAFPMMAGAQQMDPMTDPTPQGKSTEGYLIPEGAQPGQPILEAVPREAVPERNLVRDAQIALRDAGFEPGRVDGVMGPKTRAALREFQASYGLPQTGRLDSTTQERLLAQAPAPSSQR